MAKSENQKLKLLYILDYLLKQTDEEHPVTTKDIIKYLENNNISADRKTIYTDMDAISDFGVDVEFTKKGNKNGYYVGERDFELPEVKLLVDLVQSSKFITAKKSREIIGKLESLCSAGNAKALQRQVFVSGRIKADNESIYYLVDEIHRAISLGKCVSFKYFAYTPDKKQVFKKEGEKYIISPWALTWSDECYYLIGYDDNAGIIKHFRVDRMRDILMEEEDRKGKEEFDKFDLSNYCLKTFHMYSGPEEMVKIRFGNSLAGVVFDRFGTDVFLRKDGNDHFIISVSVMVSNQFFGWLTGLGENAVILGPENVKKQYKDFLGKIISNMD